MRPLDKFSKDNRTGLASFIIVKNFSFGVSLLVFNFSKFFFILKGLSRDGPASLWLVVVVLLVVVVVLVRVGVVLAAVVVVAFLSKLLLAHTPDEVSHTSIFWERIFRVRQADVTHLLTS